jgi:CheY-like chemotaxis protein
VQADRTRLKQVLLNLLGNAIKYNHTGGLVRMSFDVQGALLRIAVSDTGPGLTPEQCSRLFKPYERLGADGSVEGSGIGLALSQGLVHAMDGQIGVDSTPGRGSTFWLTLAQATRPAAPVLPLPAAREGAAAAGPGQARLVLYIEDNPVNAMLMEAMLQSLPGIQLLVSPQSREGLDLARQLHPALVLTDIQMPDVDGFEVLRRLRADEGTRAIPVLAVSANAMPDDVARSLAAGFDAYLTKPLDMPSLHAAVRKALALEAPIADG